MIKPALYSIIIAIAFGSLQVPAKAESPISDGEMNDLASWVCYTKGRHGEVSLDTEVFVSEPSSLRIINTSPDQYTGVRQIINVTPGRHYLLRGQIKTEDIMQGEKNGMGPRILISSESKIIAASKGAQKESSQDWTSIELFFIPESEQISILLYLHHYAGTVWFDDIELLDN